MFKENLSENYKTPQVEIIEIALLHSTNLEFLKFMMLLLSSVRL